MKCMICKRADIENQTMEEKIKSQNDIFLVPMEFLICPSCRERYYRRQPLPKLKTPKETGSILRVKTA